MKLINFRLDISGLSIKGCSERAKVNIEYGIRFYRCLENRDCERYYYREESEFFSSLSILTYGTTSRR